MHTFHHSIERVAKGGGTTMAQPERFAEQLNRPNNHAEIAVVSAAGKNHDLGLDIKLTDLLLDHERHGNNLARIAGHVATIGALMDPHGHDQTIQRAVGNVEADIHRWQQHNHPIASLGEKWTAEMFAAYTSREFVDAAELIAFTRQGRLDPVATRERVRGRLGQGGEVVVPGFYGSDQDGVIHLLSRGGSDVSAALIAEALSADSYHNWSDVDGFYTADPRRVEAARPIQEITRREVREMSLGCELLHPDAIRYSGDATPIHMRNTFGGSTSEGTAILPERDWSDTPIVGVVSQSSLAEISLYEYGMNEAAGRTTEVFDALSRCGAPYDHVATSADNLSILTEERHLTPRLRQQLGALCVASGHLSIRPMAALRVVGEGLANSRAVRRDVERRMEAAFAEYDIAEIGTTSAPHTASITYFIEPEQDMDVALNAVHEAIFEG